MDEQDESSPHAADPPHPLPHPPLESPVAITTPTPTGNTIHTQQLMTEGINTESARAIIIHTLSPSTQVPQPTPSSSSSSGSTSLPFVLVSDPVLPEVGECDTPFTSEIIEPDVVSWHADGTFRHGYDRNDEQHGTTTDESDSYSPSSSLRRLASRGTGGGRSGDTSGDGDSPSSRVTMRKKQQPRRFIVEPVATNDATIINTTLGPTTTDNTSVGTEEGDGPKPKRWWRKKRIMVR